MGTLSGGSVVGKGFPIVKVVVPGVVVLRVIVLGVVASGVVGLETNIHTHFLLHHRIVADTWLY